MAARLDKSEPLDTFILRRKYECVTARLETAPQDLSIKVLSTELDKSAAGLVQE